MGHHAHHMQMFKKKLWISFGLTIPVLLLSETIQTWFGFTWLRLPYQTEILLILSAIIYVYGGLPFLQGMVEELRNRQPGMMTLIGTAISVAFFYSTATVVIISGSDFFWELATLIDVMLFGHWIEARSVLGASRALEELVRIMPTAAHLLKNGQVADVPVAQLNPGDLVLVRPGEKVPSDGIVEEGSSSVNEALLTGESKPIQKEKESRVIGGAINGEGALKVRIEKTGENTYLAQVIKLVRAAQESRSRTQDLANRAAALLFYAALGSGIITFAVWSLVAAELALARTVTVLVIACPHALGLAIPLVVALSTSITAKSGILIRDRKAFEMIKDVDAIVFDKTGTLTEGKFGVTDVVAYIPEKELLELTASVEVNSEHVIAKAIVDYANDKGVGIPEAVNFNVIPGRGVFGKTRNKEVRVGSSLLLEEINIEPNDEKISMLKKQGKTVVFTVVGRKLAGAFGLADKIRKESKAAIEKLKELGLKVYMLTGDSEEVAEWVAKALGIDEHFAEVLPDQKASKIQSLREEGYKVAMVGDGINDAPALVTADVGVAIGAGTDVAIESADVVLVKNNPQDVVKVRDLSQKTYSKMMQNLWWAAGYNVIAIPLAAGVLNGVGIILPPAVGALIMSLSTVIVALNSQTLRKYEPEGVVFKEKKVTVKDPVCGMEIDPLSAFGKVEYNGRTLYFCSKKCEEDFKKKPERYV